MAFWNKGPKPSIEAEFDIEGMSVFSVRRCGDGDTAFGVTELDKEWYMDTTDEQHRAFVARLTAKISKRDQLPVKEETEL